MASIGSCTSIRFDVRSIPHAVVQPSGYQPSEKDSKWIQGATAQCVPASSPAKGRGEAQLSANRHATFQAQFWQYTNFLLQFCPALPPEAGLRANFERIGIKANAPWPPADMPKDLAVAVQAGADEARKGLDADAMKLTTSVGLFGTPQEMAGKYRERALGALAGIYGNSPEEAVYPSYVTDASGLPYDTSKFNCTLTFAPERLPPVKAFWSVTMYDMKTRFLVENPLNRYLINSTMLPQLRSCGSFTLQRCGTINEGYQRSALPHRDTPA